ncbi:hypothetical protein [Clostridium chauvoei]|uniref:Uncharacterized protein n=2 Tax=Clostridium chauvoei TaxID=46867 RepID=A0A1U6IXN5_9CLOT|nr:hypothetical protein [Clostridium chauvoei]ATD54190.1 hypothetical protein BTM20_02655 [Clostridium chauvoei]ATD58130.1 hypothetical protein BTM21_10425 [Clostridium chauvoei]MBX7279795.1 hypothetical protein [Clostridium chauvoei]MBX7282287.1 hypothetical protein [Clostridium chauvoei]MBX7284686.1 hypothetical protein [Clostridium chauvoei]
MDIQGLLAYLDGIYPSLKLIVNNSTKRQKTTIYVERKLILKLLYQPLSTVKGLDTKLFELLCSQYTNVSKILELVNRFRSILKAKDITKLDLWNILSILDI